MFSPGTFRPSRVLGLLLSTVIGLFAGFVWWQVHVVGASQKLNVSQWVVVFAAVMAVVGWMTSAIVTIRNSVKQHTINTLLQSRLSAVYMDKAGKVNAALALPNGGVKKLTADQVRAADPIVGEVTFFLNYFEFIAVGVRHGDLDEDLMRGSIRGFVRRLYSVAEEYITANRVDAAGNKTRTLEHLSWLHGRWDEDCRRADWEFRGTLTFYALALAIAAYLTPPALSALSDAGTPSAGTQVPPKVDPAPARSPASGASAPTSKASAEPLRKLAEEKKPAK